MKKLSILLLSFISGACIAADAPGSTMRSGRAGKGPAINPQTGQMYGVNPDAAQGLKNPILPTAKKEKMTIYCNTGYSQDWVGQNGHFAQCEGSSNQHCCECIIAQAVCKNERGIRANTNPTNCSQACSVNDLTSIEEHLRDKVTQDFLGQIQSVMSDARTKAAAAQVTTQRPR